MVGDGSGVRVDALFKEARAGASITALVVESLVFPLLVCSFECIPAISSIGPHSMPNGTVLTCPVSSSNIQLPSVVQHPPAWLIYHLCSAIILHG